jgi:CelD/BcsL family acetyltransferase involved in cellulose biosynthesis
VKIRRIQDLRTFRGLAPVWRELARESGQGSPFLSYDWFECCWRAVDSGREPEVLLVEDSAGPVAFVPLVASMGRLRRLPVRCLGMLSSPDTPFVDWLVLGAADSVVASVLSHLAARKDWDLLTFAGLPTGSPTLKALQAAAPDRLRCQPLGLVSSPYMSVTGSWDAFWAGTSQRFKKTLRSVRNRLDKAGRVEIEEHRTVALNSPVFQDLLDVSRRSWKGPRRLAIATMPRMVEFFRQLTERASAQGWLRLWVLRLDGRAVATEYQLEGDGRVHALRSDFDASVPDELSPGSHLNAEIVRRLFAAESVHEYDMGPGDNPYKSRWATASHETARLRLFRPGAYGACLHTVEARVVPVLRRLRPREAGS